MSKSEANEMLQQKVIQEIKTQSGLNFKQSNEGKVKSPKTENFRGCKVVSIIL